MNLLTKGTRLVRPCLDDWFVYVFIIAAKGNIPHRARTDNMGDPLDELLCDVNG